MVSMRSTLPRLLLLPVLALALVACSGSDKDQTSHAGENEGSEPTETSTGDVTSSDKKSYMVFADFVSEADSLPRMKYRNDGQVTLNDRCPVRLVRLNPKMQAAYVNGRPIGFC